MSYVVWLIFFFIIIMTGGIIGLLRYQRARKKVITDKATFLKENGKQRTISFASCDIVHREYYEENEKGEKIKKDISIITFETDGINGKKILFKTPPIFLAAEPLRNEIAKQKKTTLYYDRSNPEIYYFDVEFLVKFMMDRRSE